MHKYLVPFLLLLFWGSPSFSQSYRGMSVVNDKVVWLSGSKGTVLRTTTAGKKWDTISPRGFSRKDFRDMHAWNDKEAIIMSAGDSAVFLKTTDAGKNWVLVYVNNEKDVFFDAFDFIGDKGVAIGDPIQIKIYAKKDSFSSKVFCFLHTRNKGAYWEKVSYYMIPQDSTEAMFAASGSIIQWLDTAGENPNCVFVTGGNSPRILSPDGLIQYPLPILSGPGCGPYSMHIGKNGNISAVGGTYVLADKRDSAAIYSQDTGKTWNLCKKMPMGYRSCVTATKNNRLWVCTGTNGTDISVSMGQEWNSVQVKGYNVCAFSKKYIWFAGNKGTWQRIKIKKIRK